MTRTTDTNSQKLKNDTTAIQISRVDEITGLDGCTINLHSSTGLLLLHIHEHSTWTKLCDTETVCNLKACRSSNAILIINSYLSDSIIQEQLLLCERGRPRQNGKKEGRSEREG